ncbi:hypothetical protein [Streptomyces sp. NPDC048277]|uniref:hypothetical protein n=1 Tax=Streptomyces sp. NPDC048277 TaxID=3155027 RepID=UPI00341108C8
MIIRGATPVLTERVVVCFGRTACESSWPNGPRPPLLPARIEETAERFQSACLTPDFPPYTTTGVTGSEMGSMLKSAIVHAVGIAGVRERGDNATGGRGRLVVRSLRGLGGGA